MCLWGDESVSILTQNWNDDVKIAGFWWVLVGSGGLAGVEFHWNCKKKMTCLENVGKKGNVVGSA